MTQPRRSTAADRSIVFVVDDDASVRNGLTNLFQSVGLEVQAFASIEDFLAWPIPDAALCMVLDIRMPGRNGLEFQQDLSKSHGEIPVVFITAHGDIPMSVRAMKAGAIEFLTKPLREQDLLDAVHAGLAKSRTRREELAAEWELRRRYDSLTSREREVMAFVIGGQLSKQIAVKLGVSEITVKVCRASIMRKMGAGSLLELGRMSERLGRLTRASA